MDYFNHPLYLKAEVKTLTEGEAAVALREAWFKIFGTYPNNNQLALLWAQSALETARWKSIWCYNFGNIKKRWLPDDGYTFTMFRCSEILNGKEEWFDPPHIQTHFKAYKSAIAGAEDYIRFVSGRKRYAKAWQEVLNGDPVAYSKELRAGGYYTASESLYTKGVVRLTTEFLSKADKLLSWTANDTRPPPPPPSKSIENLFTEEEKKELKNLAVLTAKRSVENYFKTKNIEDDEELKPLKPTKFDLFSSLKNLFKGNK
jgi:hypothetical protein